MFVEDYLAREHPGGESEDPTAPPVAGGAVVRSAPGRSGRGNGGTMVVALPEHADLIRVTPTQAAAA